MNASQTGLLRQLHAYVDEYVSHVSMGACQPDIDANAELRYIIGEIEQIQTHPDQQARVIAVTRHIGDQLEQLRMANQQAWQHPHQSASKRTLGQALQDYFNTEIAYVARIGGAARREQTNLLLGDIIADLKALALEPTDEQALRLAADLEVKRKQLNRLQRPWQQILKTPQ